MWGWPWNYKLYKSVNKRGRIDSINSSLIMGSLLTNIMYKRMTFFNMGIDCRSLNSCTDTDRDNFFYSGMMRVAKGSHNVVNSVVLDWEGIGI